MSSTLPSTAPKTTASNSEEFDLVQMLLTEQQSLTAVERFSALHESGHTGADQPAQAKYYRDLLPATPPGPGQQYAFNVDLDTCSGCKACVVACHNMNGLEEDESWRRVGTITTDSPEGSCLQHVTTACHHCEDPGCLSGCPVKAYDKDPVTGIVRHLDDQCIGCKYCTMMCPYEVPRYSDQLGIVRKCDMCHQRLSAGEAPACVQSCPNEAISIEVITVAENSFSPDQRLAPDAPLSTITRPTTRYRTRRTELIEEAVAQDAGVDQVAESHWPLALMLVATQISVGMLIAERLSSTALWIARSSMPLEATRTNALFAFMIAAAGLGIAPLHLGQPLRAWRVFLGLRTSWLSREAIVLGKYVGVLGAALAFFYVPVVSDYLPQWVLNALPGWAAKAALGLAIPLGIAGLYCSAMIYIATERRLWRKARTLPRFFGTAAVCGSTCTVLSMLYGQAPGGITVALLVAALGLTTWKLIWEWNMHLGPSLGTDDRFDQRSRNLVLSHLGSMRRARLTSGAVSLLCLACGVTCLLADMPIAAGLAVATAAGTQLTGESLERLLYFASVVHDRMPGTLR